MKRAVIGITITVAVALIVGFAPLMDVPYEATETYYEDEPYEATETYYETEPLAYEVVESHTDTESYQERRQIVIGGIVFQDEIVDVSYPVSCVTLKNKDDVSGIFAVQFTCYAMDRSTAAQLCHPDFDFDEYLAAEDQEAYLDSLDWDKLDLGQFTFFADQYDGEEGELSLEPGEMGTARYSAQDIDLSEQVWRWDYKITEGTKEVEKERTVTEYHQVEKERTVTRYEKGSIFEYLRSRF
jgi:hypothetical protein